MTSGRRKNPTSNPPSNGCNSSPLINLKPPGFALSSAAATAALRSQIHNPVAIADVQTKRTLRRNGSLSSHSSYVSGCKGSWCERRNSLTSMSERSFRDSYPTLSQTDVTLPSIPTTKLSASLASSKAIGTHDNFKLQKISQNSLKIEPRVLKSSTKTQSGPSTPKLQNLDRPASKGSVNFSLPTSSRPASPAAQEQFQPLSSRNFSFMTPKENQISKSYDNSEKFYTKGMIHSESNAKVTFDQSSKRVELMNFDSTERQSKVETTCKKSNDSPIYVNETQKPHAAVCYPSIKPPTSSALGALFPVPEFSGPEIVTTWEGKGKKLETTDCSLGQHTYNKSHEDSMNITRADPITSQICTLSTEVKPRVDNFKTQSMDKRFSLNFGTSRITNSTSVLSDKLVDSFSSKSEPYNIFDLEKPSEPINLSADQYINLSNKIKPQNLTTSSTSGEHCISRNENLLGAGLTTSSVSNIRHVRAPQNSIARHSPPERAVSPRKSALRSQGASFQRASSPIGAGLDSTKMPVTEISSPRKKAARVSFDERNLIVCEDAASTEQTELSVPQFEHSWLDTNKKCSNDDFLFINDGDMMKNRPILPSFESLRGKKLPKLEECMFINPIVSTEAMGSPLLNLAIKIPEIEVNESLAEKQYNSANESLSAQETTLENIAKTSENYESISLKSLYSENPKANTSFDISWTLLYQENQVKDASNSFKPTAENDTKATNNLGLLGSSEGTYSTNSTNSTKTSKTASKRNQDFLNQGIQANDDVSATDQDYFHIPGAWYCTTEIPNQSSSVLAESSRASEVSENSSFNQSSNSSNIIDKSGVLYAIGLPSSVQLRSHQYPSSLDNYIEDSDSQSGVESIYCDAAEDVSELKSDEDSISLRTIAGRSASNPALNKISETPHSDYSVKNLTEIENSRSINRTDNTFKNICEPLIKSINLSSSQIFKLESKTEQSEYQGNNALDCKPSFSTENKALMGFSLPQSFEQTRIPRKDYSFYQYTENSTFGTGNSSRACKYINSNDLLEPFSTINSRASTGLARQSIKNRNNLTRQRSSDRNNRSQFSSTQIYPIQSHVGSKPYLLDNYEAKNGDRRHRSRRLASLRRKGSDNSVTSFRRTLPVRENLRFRHSMRKSAELAPQINKRLSSKDNRLARFSLRKFSPTEHPPRFLHTRISKSNRSISIISDASSTTREKCSSRTGKLFRFSRPAPKVPKPKPTSRLTALKVDRESVGNKFQSRFDDSSDESDQDIKIALTPAWDKTESVRDQTDSIHMNSTDISRSNPARIYSTITDSTNVASQGHFQESQFLEGTTLEKTGTENVLKISRNITQPSKSFLKVLSKKKCNHQKKVHKKHREFHIQPQSNLKSSDSMKRLVRSEKQLNTNYLKSTLAGKSLENNAVSFQSPFMISTDIDRSNKSTGKNSRNCFGDSSESKGTDCSNSFKISHAVNSTLNGRRKKKFGTFRKLFNLGE
ncbi:BgTH12-01901 [Blumeria graminis f. sp. triticale]|uniref:BgTH12-01901 n=1 Tax=Blumeria graminis f. sp. triticale TaxID=1689686 RepID=A0A9W4GED3_BLUGR|nr:BgTH12-01901 [Blumeria graminis f. sp. triticale]